MLAGDELEVERWAPPTLSVGRMRRSFFGRLARYPLLLVGAAVAVLLSSAAIAATPLLLRYGIDEGIQAGSRNALYMTLAGYMALAVIGGFAMGVRTWLMATVAQDMLHRLRLDALEGLLRLDIGTFERTERGDIQSRLTGDVEALTDATANLLPHATTLTIAIVGGFVGMLLLSPLAALVALLVLPPVLVATRWVTRRSRYVYPEYRRRLATMTGHAVETIEASETLRAFGGEGRYQQRLRELNREVTKGFMAGTHMRNRFYPTLTLVQAVLLASIVVLVSLRALDGAMSVGTAAAVILAVGGLLAPIISLAGQLDDVLSAQAALHRVMELTVIPAPSQATATLPETGRLVFEAVTFAYLKGRTVLQRIDLAIEPGERVALVGMTGSGKSTLSRLATGRARPDTGRVLFGGVDLTDANEESVNRRLLLVPQEIFLITGTIADNVRLARPDATSAEIEAAADALGIGDWLSALPDGIETPVGDGGGHLSSGEQQLVSLLRVLIANPAVIALDEATSILDDVTEARVSNALDRALAGRTVLIVAHREATAVHSDRIVVVEAGRIAEVGTPAQLLGRPAYQRLWQHADDNEQQGVPT